MTFNENDHPRDKDGKFTDGKAESSADRIKRVKEKYFPHLTEGKKMFKISLQFFAEEALQYQETASIKKGIRSKKAKIELHKMKIANPEKYVSDWNERNERAKQGLIHFWEKEIRGVEISIERSKEELRRRGEYDGE